MRKSNLGRNVIIAALFSMAAYGLYIISKSKEAYESVKSDCDDLRGRLSDVRNRIDLLSHKITNGNNGINVKKQEFYLSESELDDNEKNLEEEVELE